MKKTLISISMLFVLLLSACATHTHIIGEGAQGNSETSKRQIWVLSLVPIVEVDTNAMADGATDYEIQTQQDFIDLVIAGLTSGMISSRKVTVKK